MRSNITGIDPDYDYLFDKQQALRTDHYPICDCCGHTARPGETLYILGVKKDALYVCADCKFEMEQNNFAVEEVRYGR
ncbi:MAG: hypothetical protein ACI3VA_02120 [Candidatus Limivicinus sp.]